MIERLDHVNIRTAQLDEMVAWYGEVLDMHPGDRPNFPFPGAWLYGGGQPLVHLVTVEKTPEDGDDLRLEHAAFKARGFRPFTEKLDARGERYKLVPVEDAGVMQVNIWDPDGNHLHIDFPLSETA